MQKITPFLWFDGNAEEAAGFYTSIFANSRTTGITRYGDGMPMPAGSVMTARFLLDGQEFVALNGGPQFRFTPAISFVVNCESQQEVDRLWSALSDGGEEGQCGWLKDRFGVSWQIVPVALLDILNGGDRERAQQAMQSLMRMTKIEIAHL